MDPSMQQRIQRIRRRWYRIILSVLYKDLITMDEVPQTIKITTEGVS